jgi:hypothetical protein
MNGTGDPAARRACDRAVGRGAASCRGGGGVRSKPVLCVRPFFALSWLPVATACSGAPGPAAAAGDASLLDSGAHEGLFGEDAGTYDPDADLGLACTDAAPRFVTAVAPILDSCAGGELCHGFASPPFLYGQLVGVAAVDGCDAGVLVAPGSLQRSYLLHKLTGAGMCPNTMKMPPGGAVSPGDIQTIADWICSGAPNN